MLYSHKSLPYWHSFWSIIQGCLDIKFINVWQGSQKIFSTWFSGVESSLDFLPTSSVLVGNGYWWNPILSSKILYIAYSIVISLQYFTYILSQITFRIPTSISPVGRELVVLLKILPSWSNCDHCVGLGEKWREGPDLLKITTYGLSKNDEYLISKK